MPAARPRRFVHKSHAAQMNVHAQRVRHTHGAQQDRVQPAGQIEHARVRAQKRRNAPHPFIRARQALARGRVQGQRGGERRFVALVPARKQCPRPVLRVRRHERAGDLVQMRARRLFRVLRFSVSRQKLHKHAPHRLGTYVPQILRGKQRVQCRLRSFIHCVNSPSAGRRSGGYGRWRGAEPARRPP